MMAEKVAVLITRGGCLVRETPTAALYTGTSGGGGNGWPTAAAGSLASALAHEIAAAARWDWTFAGIA